MRLPSVPCAFFCASLCAVFFFVGEKIFAQEAAMQQALVPHTIFVGDAGRLVLTLPAAHVLQEITPFILTSSLLPQKDELELKRLELEQRGGSFRLIIDFVPYSPGVISFPLQEIFSANIVARELLSIISVLEVEVASILDSNLNPELNLSHAILSSPALPLAVRGTGLLIFGSIALILFLFFVGIIAVIWGRHNFRDLRKTIYCKYLIRRMLKFLRKLAAGKIRGKNIPLVANITSNVANNVANTEGFSLSLLSNELRNFLSSFTGINCLAFTPKEFSQMQFSQVQLHQMQFAAPPEPFNNLYNLFSQLDALRFNGKAVEKLDLTHAIKQTEDFVLALASSYAANICSPVANISGGIANVVANIAESKRSEP